MEGQRTLSIGITVNLENYENLRLEVSGPVQDESDAEELARFLDTVLQKFGRGDPSSRERVEAFRRRILPAGAPAPMAEAKAPRTGEPIGQSEPENWSRRHRSPCRTSLQGQPLLTPVTRPGT